MLRIGLALFFLVWISAGRAEDQAGSEEAGGGGTGTVVPEDASLGRLVDGLNQANLQEAFRLLRSEYIKKEDLDYLSLNRAAIQGLLERLEFGAMLLTEASRSARNSPFSFHASPINSEIGYIRFGRFYKAELELLDSAISGWMNDTALKTIVLDLRSPQSQADFVIASEILSRFRPPNELLFKIRRPGYDRAVLFTSKPQPISWGKEVVLLVDRETGNVGEIIAAVLQNKGNSVVIGEKTRGLTVEYRDVPIGEDRILRYAIAEVILEDESSIFQKGITPDLPTEPNIKAKHLVFEDTEKGTSLSRYLFREERPRMNEAALVAGTNPELDYLLAKSNGRTTKWDEIIPDDRILQKAIDILVSRDFLDAGKR